MSFTQTLEKLVAGSPYSIFILGNFIFIISFRRKCTCMDEQDPLIEDDEEVQRYSPI